MSNAPKCPTCGEPIHPLAPAGNCPRCLLGATVDGDKAEPASSGDLPEVPRFRLIEEIGEGAFGIVYRAEQTAPVKRSAAVKVMKSRAVEGVGMTRFYAERQALARMEHPGIATLYDAGESASGRPFFAMELVEGGVALNAHAEGIPLHQRLPLFRKVCAAVAHAHQKGIVHRDLKPPNILVGTDGEPRVIDFGIAKATEELLTDQTLLTRAGQMMGTPQYMSPEQAAGGMGVDTRADVYSLGAILYELVAGRPPFDDDDETTSTLETLLRSIREEIPAAPSRAEPDLSAIALKALEKDPARRYGTVAELEADVARHLAGETVSARAPSPLYRMRKFVGRHRLPVAAASVAIIALVAGGVASALLAVKANKASVAADTAEAETRRTFADSDAAAASALVEEDPAAAAAHLCRALRNVPDHPTAGYQLMRLLADHTFAQEKNSAQMNARGPMNFFEFAAGGDHLVATCEWDGAYLLRRDDFTPVSEPLEGPRHKNFRAFSSVSPDGERVLVGYRDAFSRVWSARDGSPLSPVLDTGAMGGESPVAYGPTDDRVYAAGGGGLVAAYDLDGEGGTTRAWRTRLGNVISNIGVRVIAASPDGAWVVVGSDQGHIEWLRATDGERIASAVDPGGGRILHLLFALDGARLIAATAAGSISVWDTADRTLLSQQHGHNGIIFRTATSPDGTRFATGSYDGFARVWDAKNGRPITPLLPHTSHCQGVAFSTDGTLLATSERQRFARVWDATTGEPYCAPIQHPASPSAIIFDPENGDLITGSREGVARRWDIRDRRAQPISLPDIEQPQWLAFQSDGTLRAWERKGKAATSSVRLWAPETGAERAPPTEMPAGFRWHLSRSLNPSFSTGFDGSLAPELARRLQVLGDKINTSTCVAMTPELSRLFAFHEDGRATLFDLESGATLSEFADLGHGAASCAEITPGGTHAAAAFADGTILAFDLLAQKVVGEPMRIVGLPIKRLLLTGDGSKLGAAGHGAARLWSFPDGEPLSPVLRHSDESEVEGLLCRFSPDGSVFATTRARDQSTYLWDAKDGTRLQVLYTGDSTFDLAFEEGGTLLHTVGGGSGQLNWGRLRTWDVSTGLLISKRKSTRFLEEVTASGDRSWLASAHTDRGLQIHSEPPHAVMPSWFIDAAEALTRRRFEDGQLVIVPHAETSALLENAVGRGGEIGEWADWLFGEIGDERPLAPGIQRHEQPPHAPMEPSRPSLLDKAKDAIGIR